MARSSRSRFGTVEVLTEFGEVRGVWGDLVVLRHDEEGSREGRGDGKELWSDGGR